MYVDTAVATLNCYKTMVTLHTVNDVTCVRGPCSFYETSLTLDSTWPDLFRQLAHLADAEQKQSLSFTTYPKDKTYLIGQAFAPN